MEQKFITPENLENLTENKYLLVNVAAFRARQINDGVEVYVKTRSRHPLHIALEEILEGYITYSLGGGEVEVEEIDEYDEIFRFDDFVDLEGDFDLENDEAFDFEDVDFGDEFNEDDEDEEEAVPIPDDLIIGDEDEE